MMYRRLHRGELEELEPQFVKFLAAQGIPAEDWVKLKVTDVPRADRLVEQFSDMVFDDVLRRVTYLEERSAHQLLVYRCGAERIELRGLVLPAPVEGVDFRQNLPPAEMMAALQRANAAVKLAQAERQYKPSRPADLFRMLERGARISKTAELFDLLDAVTNSDARVPR